MLKETPSLPDLEERFLPPPGWRWHSFRNPQGRKLRFGSVTPESRVPDAVVVALPGLSEFSEKYFEVAHNLLERNLSFWVLDWQGQGKSDRHLKNRHKRFSNSFDEDVADLHFFLMEYVKHSAVHPDVGRIPLVMLGHSMGGNIGLRYLLRHPDTFACAAFSAPMLGIKSLQNWPRWMTMGLTALFREAMGQSYVFGGCDWHADARANPGNNHFSSDPVRDAIHNAWCLHDPELQVGHVTFGWLHAALNSCRLLRAKNSLRDIRTPILMALAGQDMLVDNNAIRHAAAAMPHVKLLELEDAKHEILMERDDIRNRFFNAFDDLLQVNQIKKKLQPF